MRLKKRLVARLASWLGVADDSSAVPASSRELVSHLLETASLHDCIEAHHALEQACVERIYRELPGFKLRLDTPVSFARFALDRLPATRPLRILDLGCQDCLFAHTVGQELHSDTQFDCIDLIARVPNHAGGNIHFEVADIEQFISRPPSARYDCVVIGATLSLLPRAGQRELLAWVARHADTLLIREVPRLKTMIDAYVEFTGATRTGYSLYSEAELREQLELAGFSVRAASHEFDIYIEARPMVAP